MNIMLNKEEKYRILVVDSDIGFLDKITTILRKLVKNDKTFVFAEPDLEDVDRIIQNKTDIAFLDDIFFTDDELLSGLYNTNPDCLMILMISNDGGHNIKKVIKTFKNHDQEFMGEYLLKDNYPDYILEVFCKKYLDKVIPESKQ